MNRLYVSKKRIFKSVCSTNNNIKHHIIDVNNNCFYFAGQPGTPGFPGSPSYPKPSYPVAPGNVLLGN